MYRGDIDLEEVRRHLIVTHTPALETSYIARENTRERTACL